MNTAPRHKKSLLPIQSIISCFCTKYKLYFYFYEISLRFLLVCIILLFCFQKNCGVFCFNISDFYIEKKQKTNIQNELKRKENNTTSILYLYLYIFFCKNNYNTTSKLDQNFCHCNWKKKCSKSLAKRGCCPLHTNTLSLTVPLYCISKIISKIDIQFE